MPTSAASGEPLRPHFPPQQHMQVMRMATNAPGTTVVTGPPGGHQMTQIPGGPNIPGGPMIQGAPNMPGAPTIQGQMPQGNMMVQQQPPHLQPQASPMQSMQQMRPPPPGMATGSLRLSIPPQQQVMPPQPRTPGSTGSQQPSPALTPRSGMGDDDMDSNSSRGPTPAPGDPGYDGPLSGMTFFLQN